MAGARLEPCEKRCLGAGVAGLLQRRPQAVGRDSDLRLCRRIALAPFELLLGTLCIQQLLVLVKVGVLDLDMLVQQGDLVEGLATVRALVRFRGQLVLAGHVAVAQTFCRGRSSRPRSGGCG